MNKFWLLCYLSLGIDINNYNILTSVFIAYYRTVEYRKHLLIVQQRGWLLKNVPDELKTLEICLIAVKHNEDALQYVPHELKTIEFCLVAVQHCEWALQYVPTTPRDLRTLEICLAAVQRDRNALLYVPYGMKEEIKRLAGID